MELSKSRDMVPRPPTIRMRSSIHESVQTEATFVPSCMDLKHTYEPEAAEQFDQLRQLRTLIQGCLEEVAGSVYDMVGFKDIMFKMEEEFPTSLPVTDMLLLTSKLNRKTTELSRLISCFFGVVFADCHADEHFHFTEIRLVQRELLDVKRKLKESENEKLQLQETLNNVGQVALDHGKAVELLEQHNQALQLQTSALEDQMALLFHQVNSDLETHCKEAYEKVTLDMEIQERMNPTRTTYRQTIDSLSQQIRTARTIITDLREVLVSCSQGNRTGEAYLAIEPSVKYKLKLLDSNFQQLAGRFTSVKDTVTETAHELVMALHERKRILYLSFQHIRLYDLQAAKLRSAKAIMTQILNYTGDLLQRAQSTFPGGAITSVDRIGRITTQRWHGGYTLAALKRIKSGSGAVGQSVPDLDEAQLMAAESELAALEKDVLTDDRPPSMDATKIPQPVTFISTPSRGNNSSSADCASRKRLSSGSAILPNGKLPPSPRKMMPLTTGAERIDGTVINNAVPFPTIYELFNLMRDISADIEKLNGSLTLDDEMAVFLKTLTLSVASTARANAPETGLERYEGGFEDALMPTGGLTSYSTKLTGDTVNDTRHREEMPPSVIGQSTPTKLDTSVDMRLSRAEQAQSDARLARQAQQLLRHQEQITKLQDDFSCRLGFLRQVYESRITDLEMKKCAKQDESPDRRRRRNASNKPEDDLQLVRDVNAFRGQDDDLMKVGVKTDREELLTARGEWRRTKLAVQSTRKLREATTNEIEKIERKIEEKRSASAKKKRMGPPSRTS